MREAVIVSTARTPIGKAYRGGFNNLAGASLGAASVAEAVQRAGVDPSRVDDGIMGAALQQGAKTLPAGGYYTMPRLALDGAVVVGDSASMLNIQRLKGVHTAMKSGMLAAEAILTAAWMRRVDDLRERIADLDARRRGRGGRRRLRQRPPGGHR